MIMYARALYRSFKVKWKRLFSHTFILLSILSYEARIIMYARALYSSFKV